MTKQTKEQFCKVINRWAELRQKVKAAKEAREQEEAGEEFTSKMIKPWINNTRW